MVLVMIGRGMILGSKSKIKETLTHTLNYCLRLSKEVNDCLVSFRALERAMERGLTMWTNITTSSYSKVDMVRYHLWGT